MSEIKFQIKRMVSKLKFRIKRLKFNLFTKPLSYEDKVKVIDYALEKCINYDFYLSLCNFLNDGLRIYNLHPNCGVLLDHKKLFPKFKRENFDSTQTGVFWWNPNDIESRVKALNKLKELEK